MHIRKGLQLALICALTGFVLLTSSAPAFALWNPFAKSKTPTTRTTPLACSISSASVSPGGSVTLSISSGATANSIGYDWTVTGPIGETNSSTNTYTSNTSSYILASPQTIGNYDAFATEKPSNRQSTICHFSVTTSGGGGGGGGGGGTTPVPDPTASISADPTVVSFSTDPTNKQVTITYSGTDATTCKLSDITYSTTGITLDSSDGTQKTYRDNPSKKGAENTYRNKCTNSNTGKSAEMTVSVFVNDPATAPVVTQFTADPSTITSTHGSYVYLTWKTQYVTTSGCTITQQSANNQSKVPLVGFQYTGSYGNSVSVPDIVNYTTTYEIICRGDPNVNQYSTPVTATVTVQKNTNPPPPNNATITLFTAVTPYDSIRPNWDNFKNATSTDQTFSTITPGSTIAFSYTGQAPNDNCKLVSLTPDTDTIITSISTPCNVYRANPQTLTVNQDVDYQLQAVGSTTVKSGKIQVRIEKISKSISKLNVYPEVIHMYMVQSNKSSTIPSEIKLSVVNSGTSTLRYTVSTNDYWLSANPVNGTINANYENEVKLQLTDVANNLSVGDYNGQLKVIGYDENSGLSSLNSPVNIQVILHVVQSPSSVIYPVSQKQKCFDNSNVGHIICGRVLDASTGKPIKGALLSFYGISYAISNITDGSYYIYFPGLPGYNLQVSAVGYTKKSQQIYPAVSQKLDISLDKELGVNYSISGRLIDRKKYAPNSQISVVLKKNGVIIDNANVDNSDMYQFRNIGPGEYTIVPRSVSMINNWIFDPPEKKLQVSNSSVSADFTIKNRSNSLLYGHVYFDGSTTVPQKSVVSLSDSNNNIISTHRINPDGSYNFKVDSIQGSYSLTLVECNLCTPKTPSYALSFGVDNIIYVNNKVDKTQIDINIISPSGSSVGYISGSDVSISYLQTNVNEPHAPAHYSTTINIDSPTQVSISINKKGFSPYNTTLMVNPSDYIYIDAQLSSNSRCIDMRVRFCFSNEELKNQVVDNDIYYHRLELIDGELTRLKSLFSKRMKNPTYPSQVDITSDDAVNAHFNENPPNVIEITFGLLSHLQDNNIVNTARHEFGHLLDFDLGDASSQSYCFDSYGSDAKYISCKEFISYQILGNINAYATKVDSKYYGFGGHPHDNTTEEFATLFITMADSDQTNNKLLKNDITKLKNIDSQAFMILCNEYNYIASLPNKPLQKINNCPKNV